MGQTTFFDVPGGTVVSIKIKASFLQFSPIEKIAFLNGSKSTL